MKPQQPAQQKQDTNLIEAEIEHNIPVKQHISDELKNPIAAIKQFVEHDKKEDKELDKVLKDVNESVKNGGKKPVKIGKTNTEKSHGPKPVLAIVAAVLVAAGLSFAAFNAFSSSESDQKSNKTKTTAQSSGGETAVLSEPDKLAKALKEKLDGLNDSQEFNTTDLSDQNLGL